MSEFHKSTYYAVPKCASSTLKYVLCHNIENKFIPGCGDDDYFKFSVVRNPWDRLVSMYFNCKREFNPITGEPLNEITIEYFDTPRNELDFDTYIAKIYEKKYFIQKNFDMISFESHFWPCNNFVPKNIDYVVKYKNFHEDIKYVLTRLDINIELPVLNKSNHNDYREYYTERNLDMVDNMYRADLERFDFTFKYA